jgi:hypothetical protein
MRLRAVPLFAIAVLTTGNAVAAHAAGPAQAADCLADTTVMVPPPTFMNMPHESDPFVVTPSHSAFEAAVHVSECIGTDTSLTVSRPDGSSKHQAKLDQLCEYADCGTPYQWGSDKLPYATATGPWRITAITSGGRTATLTNAVSFTLKRASVVTLSASVDAPSRPRASGIVTYWTAQGVQAPTPGRRVDIVIFVDGKPRPLTSTTTDRNGRYSVALPAGTEGAYVHARVQSTSTLGWAVSYLSRVRVLNPTSITGTAAPTSATVIRNGTKMSTYGHLRVLTRAGKSIPYPGRTVVVQTRPKANPSAGYSTVASATTTNTGYYYANWNASVDADVRVAFLSPYSTIASSYRWVRSLDVR